MPEDFGIRLMKLSDDEFNLIRSLVYERFGIHLTEAKKSLVVGRLQKTLRLLGLTSFKQFYDYLMEDTSGAALDALVNQISTNHHQSLNRKYKEINNMILNNHTINQFVNLSSSQSTNRKYKHHNRDILQTFPILL